MTIDQLQKDYPEFSYHSFEYAVSKETLLFTFTFSVGAHTFHPTIAIAGVTSKMLEDLGKDRLDAWAFQLGLAEIATYWKAFCSPVILIECGFLDQDQLQFWQKLIYKGMGEFFFQNKIEPFTPEIRIKNKELRIEDPPRKHQATTYLPKTVLVPVGGGKDSIVTLELLASAGYKVSTTSAHQGASGEVTKLFAKRHPQSETQDIIFTRTIDPHLLTLNSQGYLNGHTPFSSVLAFLLTLEAEIFGIPTIAISNEGSSNEPTAIWNGIDVNHQYSKSFEFESDFQSYIGKVLPDSPIYFSFLRPWYELQIVEKFVRFPEYFGVFKSCNVGQKTNGWCGRCPKCTFVALLLAAYLDDETISNIFGKAILDDSTLSKHVDELIGIVEYKPFECVGTRSETQAALFLAMKRREGRELPALLGQYGEWVEQRAEELGIQTNEILSSFGTAHSLSEEFEQVLRTNLKPSGFKAVIELPAWLQSANSIAIVGFGREGQSTYRFLRTHLPKDIHINTYDENMDQSMRELSHQLALEFDDRHFIGNTSLDAHFGTEDVIFKTPGIPLSKLKFHAHAKEKIYITSQADLFIQLFGRQTIGVTGTKGKSTTAHAISEVLNASGHHALLVGNIGKPALDFVDQMREDTTAVFELSAFQCESLHSAPHIGVFTSLYQDHLDYYPTMDLYAKAKKHLFDLQTSDDICLYRDDYSELVTLLKECAAQKIGYRQSETEGEVNFVPAKKIALMLGISSDRVELASENITSLPGRLEKVGNYHGVSFFDDALATIPEATIRAIKKLGNVDTLFVGGFDRHQQFEELVTVIGTSGISTLILFPETGDKIGALVAKSYPNIRLLHVDSMEEAIRASYDHTPANGVVLLSTASPSFGLFKDYTDRSEQYAFWIKKLSTL